MGIWTGRTARYAEDQRPLYWLNGTLQTICAVSSLALLAATAAMLHCHLTPSQAQQNIIVPSKCNSTASSSFGPEPICIGLKAAVLAMYVLLFIVTVIFAAVFARKRRQVPAV